MDHLDIRHYPSRAVAAIDMAREGAEFLASRIEDAGFASLFLTGGSSVKELYHLWATEYNEAVDWTKVHIFWGDDRRVPHTHEESNVEKARMLLDQLHFTPSFVHKWDTEIAPQEALANMERRLNGIRSADGELRPDLVLLGVGEDGHIASLFPKHMPWVELKKDQAPNVAYITDSPKPPAERFTFTFPLINQAEQIWLLPFGDAKKEVLTRLLARDVNLPVTHVHAREETIIWTDQLVEN